MPAKSSSITIKGFTMIERHHKLLSVPLLLAAYALLSGCATIVHLGGSEEINVSSEPDGAKVVIDGTELGVTPLATKVERKKDHALVLTKEGFQETQTKVESHLSWWVAGNALVGGLVGILVDVLTGGGYTLELDAVAQSQACRGNYRFSSPFPVQPDTISAHSITSRLTV